MKTQKLTAILAGLILLSGAIAQEDEQEQREKVSNTLTASCLVKVTCDPAIMPLTFETIDYLMHSSGVAGRAAVEALGPRDEPYEHDEWFSIEPLSVGPTKPEPDDQPKPAARPTARGRRPLPRPDDDEGLDARALEEMRYFEQKAKFQRRQYSEEDERKERRSRSRRAPDSGKIVRGLTPAGAAAAPTSAEQSLLFQLQVDLEDREVKAAAEEFMKALIDNLRETLMVAYDAYHQKIDHESAAAKGHRDWARDRLSEALGLTSHTDADHSTRKQLEKGVGLSNWTPDMSFFDALDELKNSVDPPLRMVVLWGDLLENAEIDQTTPINMDPLPEVRSSKALDLLLRSVASGTGVELGYEIDGGIITIATADRLPSAERRLSQITQTDVPMETLLERRNDMFRNKQELEMEIARREAQQSAIEEQIGRIDAAVAEKVNSDPTAFEIQRLIDINARELERARQALESGKRVTGIDEVTEKLARAKIDLAKRREELSNAAGGNRLRDLNVNLTDVTIDLAVEKAEFEVVSRQLAETEEQLKKASTVDPEISQIRLAQEELEITERQVTELRIRRANLWKPTVTVLGGI